AVEIAKAGLFSFELELPEGFDIDTLGGPEVSHWDESTVNNVRSVQVHLKRKMLGTVALNVALSRSIGELPKRIAVPRVAVTGSVKHTGQIKISSDRGVRLSIAGREGVSELNP